MNIYNASHKKDLTAYEAIRRADRHRKDKAIKQPIERGRLTYKVCEVVALEYVNGVVRIWQKVKRNTG